MAAKGTKQQGMRLNLTLFIPYDPAKPESITAASTKANSIVEDHRKGGEIVVEKHTITAASISTPAPAPAASQ